MLTPPTLDKLHALKLPAMAHAWTEQQQHAELAALSFDERFGLLVDAEWLARENKRLARALQEAKLKLAAGLHRGHRLSGPPRARQGRHPPARHLPLDRRAPERPHHRRHRHRQELRRLRPRPPGLPPGLPRLLPPRLPPLRRAPPGPRRRHLRPPPRQARPRSTSSSSTTGASPRSQDQERRDLLEILEDRYGTRSTIVTSQLPPAQWHDHIGEPDPGRCHLRSAPPQRPPTRAKRTLTEKGGQARQLIGRPASLRSDHDPRSARSRWTDLGVQLRRYTQLKAQLEAWRARTLADLDLVALYLDGFHLRVRLGGRVRHPVSTSRALDCALDSQQRLGGTVAA